MDGDERLAPGIASDSSVPQDQVLGRRGSSHPHLAMLTCWPACRTMSGIYAVAGALGVRIEWPGETARALRICVIVRYAGEMKAIGEAWCPGFFPVCNNEPAFENACDLAARYIFVFIYFSAIANNSAIVNSNSGPSSIATIFIISNSKSFCIFLQFLR